MRESNRKVSLQEAAPRISKKRLLPVLFGKVIKRIARESNRFRVPVLHRLIKYPDLSRCMNVDNRGRYYFDSRQRSALIEKWRECFDFQTDVIYAADEVCEHIFDMLGSGKTSLGADLDWQADFKTGISWPSNVVIGPGQMQAFYGKADIKVPWELSRFQHASLLGKAYWLTDDEKYAREFANQISDWVDKNRWGYGANWACAMDVAIRAANWVLGYHFFERSPSLDADFHNKFLRSLWEHGWFIRWNLEKGAVNGNHYISDLAGLFAVGIFFSDYPQGRKWRDFALTELFREMRIQILDDGVNYEKSISYHRLVLELFTYSYVLAELNGIRIPDDIRARWEKMFDFVAAYTKPDGTIPQIGDADDGMFYKLFTPRKTAENSHPEFSDHRYLLSFGAVLFGRNDLMAASAKPSEEAFWSFGAESVEGFDGTRHADTSAPRVAAFCNGGFYIVRSSDQYAIIDAGDNGTGGIGGHAHNDWLSFELYAFDKTFIVDPGSYVYTIDPKWRNTFRSTAYHNTVMIDGEEINPVSERWLFGLPDAGGIRVIDCKVEDGKAVFEGEHDAYTRLSEPVVHRRSIGLDTANNIWTVEDSFSGSGKHLFESRLHFAPGIDIRPVKDVEGLFETVSEGANINIAVRCDCEFETAIEDGWYSPSYGCREPIKILKFSWTGPAGCSFNMKFSGAAF